MKKTILCKRIHTRITKEKYDELVALLQKSYGMHTLSELLRNILNHKVIVVKSYDVSLDKVMTELSLIRRELQVIGININQVVRCFHTGELAEDRLFQAMEIVKLYQQTDSKVTELFLMIAKLSELWLPK